MMDKEILYSKLPSALQNLACSLEGWLIQRKRYSYNFYSLLSEAEQRTFSTVDEVSKYRDRRLRIFIEHCYDTVPFYRKLFNEMGFKVSEFETINDLQKLPILNKEQVKENLRDLVSVAISKKDQVVAHTSGTTGGGLRFVTTVKAIQEQWAIWWRYRRWHGIFQDIWCGYFGGRSVVPLSQKRPPFWRYNYPGKQILFSAYHMSSKNMDYYVKELCKKQPVWLHGYPSLLSLIATHIIEKGIRMPYQIRWVTTGAENLLLHQKEIIEKAFGVSPIQHYGLAEAVANISQCPLGRLHVDEDFAAVEFVPNTEGIGYKIIGTNFTNLATPLLRYDTQDLAELSGEVCSCGRPGRVVARIDGRAEDYVILKNGARLGRLDHIFKDIVNIKEAQICQKTPGEITIRVVPGKMYGQKDEIQLLKETYKRVGQDTHVRIEYVDSVERSAMGKLRFVVNEIPEGMIFKE